MTATLNIHHNHRLALAFGAVNRTRTRLISSNAVVTATANHFPGVATLASFARRVEAFRHEAPGAEKRHQRERAPAKNNGMR